MSDRNLISSVRFLLNDKTQKKISDQPYVQIFKMLLLVVEDQQKLLIVM